MKHFSFFLLLSISLFAHFIDVTCNNNLSFVLSVSGAAKVIRICLWTWLVATWNCRGCFTVKVSTNGSAESK